MVATTNAPVAFVVEKRRGRAHDECGERIHRGCQCHAIPPVTEALHQEKVLTAVISLVYNKYYISDHNSKSELGLRPNQSDPNSL